MQRPIPETAEEIINENFRVFVKWAFSLLISNEKIVGLGMPEFVCVSMPREDSTGMVEWENVVGVGGLAFKVGAAINGTMDNIALWAGLGEMPEDTTVTYTPAS
jgi:hypothetical protein